MRSIMEYVSNHELEMIVISFCNNVATLVLNFTLHHDSIIGAEKIVYFTDQIFSSRVWEVICESFSKPAAQP